MHTCALPLCLDYFVLGNGVLLAMVCEVGSGGYSGYWGRGGCSGIQGVRLLALSEWVATGDWDAAVATRLCPWVVCGLSIWVG